MFVRGGLITLLLTMGIFSASTWAQLDKSSGQFFHQNSADTNGNAILDFSETNDRFGHALASGDFNNDGFADLAIGAHQETIGSGTDRRFAGVVNLIYGSGTGLDIANNERLTQNTLDPGGAEAADFFGAALAMGNFNNDEFDDLVIGARGESLDNIFTAGAIFVLFGSASGITSTNNQMFHQDSNGILGEAETGDFFGSALAAGDFDGDEFDDVAVGSPNDNVIATDSTGTVNILYGSGNGLSNSGDQLFHQDSPGIEDAAEFSDQFGAMLAVGDFDNDTFDDLAIGVPGESLFGVPSAGAVHVLYGSAKPQRLNSNRSQFLAQSLSEISESPKAEDRFGEALVTGDFNGDSFADLAVGVPGESINNDADAGKVHIFFGSANGLSSSGSQLISQGSVGIADDSEANDQFGSALASGDFNGDNFDDLAIGVPNEGLNGSQRAGAINILYGSSLGLAIEDNQLFSQADIDSELDGLEENDFFGLSLSSADFDNDGFDDLSVGAPGETINAKANAGAINVLYGAPDPIILIDRFE